MGEFEYEYDNGFSVPAEPEQPVDPLAAAFTVAPAETTEAIIDAVTRQVAAERQLEIEQNQRHLNYVKNVEVAALEVVRDVEARVGTQEWNRHRAAVEAKVNAEDPNFHLLVASNPSIAAQRVFDTFRVVKQDHEREELAREWDDVKKAARADVDYWVLNGGEPW